MADPGEMSWGLNEGVYVGDELAWMTHAERADAERVEREFAALAATVDPDDPWSHPRGRAAGSAQPRGLAASSTARCPPCVRRHELALAIAVVRRAGAHLAAGASCASTRRSAGEGFYDLERWEGLRVAEGSAAVALSDGRRARRRGSGSGPVVTEIDVGAAAASP